MNDQTLKLALRIAALVTGTEDVEALRQKVENLGETEKQVGEQDAFKNLKIRGSQEIQAEIQKIQQSLLTLGTSSNVSMGDLERATQAAEVEITKLRAEMSSQLPDPTKKAQEGMAFMRGLTRALGYQLASVLAAGE